MMKGLDFMAYAVVQKRFDHFTEQTGDWQSVIDKGPSINEVGNWEGGGLQKLVKIADG